MSKCSPQERRADGTSATLKASHAHLERRRICSGETLPSAPVGYIHQSKKHGARVRQKPIGP